MKTSELLSQARQLITKPENWTQGTYARDKDGKNTWSYNTNAFCFCSVGALQSIAAYDLNLLNSGKTVLKDAMNVRRIEDYNDNNSHEKVLGMFDKAITMAREKEPK